MASVRMKWHTLIVRTQRNNGNSERCKANVCYNVIEIPLGYSKFFFLQNLSCCFHIGSVSFLFGFFFNIYLAFVLGRLVLFLSKRTFEENKQIFFSFKRHSYQFSFWEIYSQCYQYWLTIFYFLKLFNYDLRSP